MKKQHKKIHRFNRPSVIATVAVIGCLTAILAFASSVHTYRLLMADEEVTGKTQMNMYSDQGQMKFCYDNNIRPCDDIAINTFNALPENVASGNQFHSFHY